MTSRKNNGTKAATVEAPEADIRIPDLLGDKGREAETDQMYATIIGNNQAESARLDEAQRINEHEDDDVVPEQGPRKTYAERRDELAKQLRKVALAAGQDRLDRIEEQIRSQRT